MKKIIVHRNLLIALISVILGLVMLYVNLVEENGGVPYKINLVAETGIIEWVHLEKYGVKFKFSNSDIFLNYPSKLGSMTKIYKELKDSIGSTVIVLYKKTVPRKGFDGDVYNDVWQIFINNRLIQSYEESEKSWRSDELWLWVIIPLFLFGGSYIGWQSYHRAGCHFLLPTDK